MFSDSQARRLWRQFLLRTELTLSSVSAGVRRELIEDLSAHIQDLTASDTANADELARLKAALARVGDPRQFLAPLIEEAVFRVPHRDVGLASAIYALVSLVARGWRLTLWASTIMLTALLGAVALLISIGSLVRPENIGVFSLGADEIQIRILGGHGGAPVLAPWLSFAALALGVALMWATRRGVHAIVLEILLRRGEAT